MKQLQIEFHKMEDGGRVGLVNRDLIDGWSLSSTPTHTQESQTRSKQRTVQIATYCGGILPHSCSLPQILCKIPLSIINYYTSAEQQSRVYYISDMPSLIYKTIGRLQPSAQAI